MSIQDAKEILADAGLSQQISWSIEWNDPDKRYCSREIGECLYLNLWYSKKTYKICDMDMIYVPPKYQSEDGNPYNFESIESIKIKQK